MPISASTALRLLLEKSDRVRAVDVRSEGEFAIDIDDLPNAVQTLRQLISVEEIVANINAETKVVVYLPTNMLHPRIFYI